MLYLYRIAVLSEGTVKLSSHTCHSVIH